MPEEALTPSGKQDPNMFVKQLNQMVQVLPVGAKFDSIEHYGDSMTLSIVTTLSAPPMTTKDVSGIEGRLEKARPAG